MKEAFKETAIIVTVQGQRHVGAAIRSQEYVEEYVNDKVTNWISTITKLAEFNVTQPQASYAAYTFGLYIDGPISRELCQKSKTYLNTLSGNISRSLPCHYRSAVWLIGQRHTSTSSPFGRIGNLVLANLSSDANLEYTSSV